MTHINLTLSEETLHHLISGDDQGISMLLREALNQILEHQRTDQIDAARYERLTPARDSGTAINQGNLIPESEP